jgi:hypothetical protein
MSNKRQEGPAREPKRTTGLSWWNASHRDKFRRTLWLAPFVVLIAVLWSTGYSEPPLGLSRPIAVLGIVALWAWQAFMEYSKWKKGL